MASPKLSAGSPSRARLSGDRRADALADFDRHVRNALIHLHDPAYLQTSPLTQLLEAEAGSRAASPTRALHRALLDAVQTLCPGPEAPSDSHAWRIQQILSLRYVEALDILTVQARLAIGNSEYYRDHRRALDAVTTLLRERWHLADKPTRLAEARVLDRDRHERSAQPSSPLDAPPHRLPIPLTSFVGREHEISEVESLLARTRLLTLTGSGGCGKSRLALQVASQLSEGYPGAVWLVELAALADPTLVPQAVAATLGLVEESGYSIVSTLADYLRPRRGLLLLDNCEHLVGACARLADALLRACPSLTVLTTSREALRIDGETCWTVPPLDTPDPERLPPLAELACSEAVRLFAERAGAVTSGFHLTAENASDVARICWRLDGMPLAIELAAARVRVLTPEQIAARLDDRFSLLTGGSRTALPRQQTLAATLDWSHDLLADQEKMLFRRLAIFAGGWTLEAAEAVCGGWGPEVGPPRSEALVRKDDYVASGPVLARRCELQVPGSQAPARTEVLDPLARLVEKSLVQAEAQGGEVRYRLPETVREYAREKLGDSGEAADVRGRHRDWYLALAEEVEYRGRCFALWPDRLAREHDNFRAALEWSRAEEDGAESELRLAAALAHFQRSCGFETEARERLAHALARSVGLLPATRAAALMWLGLSETFGGNPGRAKELYDESLALAREVGDPALIACALRHLAWSAETVGRLAEARSLLEEALPLVRSSGDGFETASVLEALGVILVGQGDRAGARCLFEESLAIAQLPADRQLVREFISDLAELALADGDYPRARVLFEEELANAREIGKKEGIARALGSLGDLARAEGDRAGAESLYLDFLTAVRESGSRLVTAMALGRLADLWAAREECQRATRVYGALGAWYAAAGMPVPFKPHPDHELDLATARVTLGEDTFARAWAEGQAMTLERAVEYALSVDDKPWPLG